MAVIDNTNFGQNYNNLQTQLNQPITKNFNLTGNLQIYSNQSTTLYQANIAKINSGLTAGGNSYINYSSQSTSDIVRNELIQKGVETGTNNFSSPTQMDPSTAQLPPQDQQAWLNNAYAGIAGDGSQREITCSICGGQILSTFTGRLFFYIGQFLQRFEHIVVPIGVILNYFKERGAIPAATALKTCGACQNKRKLKDPSDDSAKYAQAASIAQSLAPQIEAEEAKLQPPGGNVVFVTSGNIHVQSGLDINKHRSYRIEEGGIRNKGVAMATANSKYSARTSEGGTAKHVQGIQVPALPGGNYTIVSGNKFSLLTGAQGVDITTGGPINIDGGMTRITGPEVSIITQSGPISIEGDVVKLSGKSIEVSPSDGHLYTRGTMSCSGNCIVGGHAHSESASIVKLSTVGRNDNSKAASSSNIYGGPAFWGGQNTEGITAALKELLAFTTVSTTHPVLVKEVGPLSFRYSQTLNDNFSNLAYMLRPRELVQTGVALLGEYELPVYNYPHVHAMPDQPHSHGMRVPDIDCTAEHSEQLRGMFSDSSGHAPIHRKSTSLIDVLLALWEIISAVWVSTGKQLLEGNYKK